MSAQNTLQYNATEHVTANGAQSGGLATLRHEFADRIGEAFHHFRDSTDLLRQAADALGEAGIPPGYQVLQTLGDCQRRFSRLCLDLSRRAGELGLTIPLADQFHGISDVYQFLGSESSVSTAPPSVETPDTELPPNYADVSHASPDPVELDSVASHDLPSLEPVPEPTVVDGEHSPPEPAETAVALENSGVTETESTTPPPPQAPELFGGWYAPAHEVQPEPELTHEHEISPAHEQETVVEEPAPLAADEPLRRHAVDVLNRALSLRTRDGSEFAPLSEFLDDAAALREAIESSPADALPMETHRLAEGTHPICGLLTVIEGVAGLSDAQWAELHSTVTEAFGRQMAVSAARGRIVIGL